MKIIGTLLEVWRGHLDLKKKDPSGAYFLKYREDIAHAQTKVIGIKAGTNSIDAESIKCDSYNW